MPGRFDVQKMARLIDQRRAVYNEVCLVRDSYQIKAKMWEIICTTWHIVIIVVALLSPSVAGSDLVKPYVLLLGAFNGAIVLPYILLNPGVRSNSASWAHYGLALECKNFNNEEDVYYHWGSEDIPRLIALFQERTNKIIDGYHAKKYSGLPSAFRKTVKLVSEKVRG